MIKLYDGARAEITGTPEVLVTVYDTNRNDRVSQYVKAGSVRVTGLEIHDDGTDQRAVIAAMRGCSDGGLFPVPIAADQESTIDLMLPPRKVGFDLASALWDNLRGHRVFDFLADAAPEDSAKAYEQMRQNSPMEVACLHNITTAIDLLPDQPAGGVLGFFKKGGTPGS